MTFGSFVTTRQIASVSVKFSPLTTQPDLGSTSQQHSAKNPGSYSSQTIFHCRFTFPRKNRPRYGRQTFGNLHTLSVSEMFPPVCVCVSISLRNKIRLHTLPAQTVRTLSRFASKKCCETQAFTRYGVRIRTVGIGNPAIATASGQPNEKRVTQEGPRKPENQVVSRTRLR
jgi:hypothetical protein